MNKLLNKRFRLSKSPKRMAKKRKATVYSAFFILFFAVVTIVLIRSIRTYQVDGISMIPTFKNGDRLFIHKDKRPERYDLITFYPKENEQTSYVKRIVGLPGDSIHVEGNAVYINQQLGKDGVLANDLLAKELPDGSLKVTISKNVWEMLSEVNEIPNDCYFVLGDNRTNSTDSRHLGFINKSQIDGVVIFRYYPFDSLGLIK